MDEVTHDDARTLEFPFNHVRTKKLTETTCSYIFYAIIITNTTHYIISVCDSFLGDQSLPHQYFTNQRLFAPKRNMWARARVVNKVTKADSSCW